MDSREEKKAWREVKNKERFLNAVRGMRVFWATTRNLMIYTVISAIVIALGFYFSLSNFEWIALIFSIGFVIVSEAFNTAIEIDMDLTAPEYHPYARDTKDVAACAVLISAFISIIIGFIIFLPKIFNMI